MPAPSSDLDAAIRQVQAGETEAFAVVVRAYERPLRAWLARDCVPGIDGDDIAHRAFITAYGHIHEFTPGGNCFAWLCTIARNHLRDEVKRIRRTRVDAGGPLGRLAGLEAEAVDADAAPEDDRRMQALRTCLQRLPAELHALLEQRYVHGLPLAGIAGALGTSPGAVKVRLHHLRRRLHACVTARLAGEVG